MSFYLSINKLKDDGTFNDVTEMLGYDFNYVGSEQLACLIERFPTDTNLGSFIPEDCQEYFRPKSETFHELLTAAIQNPYIQDVTLESMLSSYEN